MKKEKTLQTSSKEVVEQIKKDDVIHTGEGKRKTHEKTQ